MQVIVEGKNVLVTEALRLHAEKQAQKLGKVSHLISVVRVYLETVAKKHNDPSANTATFHIEMPGKDATITKKAVDMYEAIISAAEGAVRQVQKAVEKQRSH